MKRTEKRGGGGQGEAEVARSGDLYQSQRTPVTMATKLDFFFFRSFFGSSRRRPFPKRGREGRGKGGGSTKEMAVAAAAVSAAEGKPVVGETGEKEKRGKGERKSIEKVGEALTNGDRGSQ